MKENSVRKSLSSAKLQPFHSSLRFRSYQPQADLERVVCLVNYIEKKTLRHQKFLAER